MLPLDTVTSSLTLNNPDKLQSYLTQLKNAKVQGVMVCCGFISLFCELYSMQNTSDGNVASGYCNKQSYFE